MPIKLFIIIAIGFSQFVCLYSQTPSYYHYTSSDGLASSTVYDIIQDRDGFIWFATANGISKFDGKRFTTFRTKDGLNSNSIISLVENKNGELYIGNYEKGINVLRNGRIENYCSKIKDQSFFTSYLMLLPSEKDEQKLYAYKTKGSINSIIEKKPFGLITNSFSLNPTLINKLGLLSDSSIIALTTAGLYNFINDTLTKLNVEGLPDNDYFSIAPGKEGSYVIGAKGIIYRIKKDSVIKKYEINLFGDNNISHIFRDSNNNIWFSIMHRGFFFIPNGSDKIIDMGIKMGLQNTLVNHYLEDREGNIWISTFGKGVYSLNNLYIKSYNESDGLSSNSVYSIVKERSGKLLIGTFNGVDILENGRFDRIKTNTNKTSAEYIYRIKNLNNEFYICGTFNIKNIKNILYNGLKLHLSVLPSFCKTSDGLYLYGSWNNFLHISKEPNLWKGKSLIYIFGDSSKVNRINEIFEDTNKNIWIGTSLGLCKITRLPQKTGKDSWLKSFFPNDSVLNSKIVSIYQDNQNNVWFAGVNGIARYSLKNDSVKSFTNINGFDLSSSTSIVSDSKNRMWIGNMKGLYLYDGNSTRYLNSQTGLPSNEVLSLYFDEDENFMYIGTSKGISFLDINMFDGYKPTSLNVKIISVKAGDSVYTNYNNLVFEPEQNNVSINFKALSFSSPKSVKYKYKLNNKWTETNYDFLNLISLKYGTYNLQIMAKSQNADWSKPYFLSFSILPRFVETIWFNILIILFLVCVSVFVIIWKLKLNNKKISEQLELTERINDLKHKALSAMMNPHFIFNSLNSVQYLVNFRRNEEANDYIAMMAKLIRKNLDTAGSGFILLAEEINRLKLYLELEKLRFQERFSYEIIAGADVDIDSIMIPNMIIQPFVENSLWHGIINSGKEGLLTVSFSFEDVDIDSIVCQSLIIKITDNGIGIKEAKKNKSEESPKDPLGSGKEDHISKGIQIIEERLRLLSTKMHLPKPIMFDDLSNLDGNLHGTEVIISLPQPLYKVIAP